jgi:hypothetical protein
MLAIAGLALTGCATAPVKPIQYVPDASLQQEIEVPGMSKKDIFNKSRQWYALTFKSSKQAIEYEDANTGRIIAKGADTVVYKIDMPFGGNQSFPQPVGFTIIQDIKDGKTKLQFSNIGLLTYNGGNYSNIDTVAWQQLEPRLAKHAADLKAFLLTADKGW